MQKQMCKHDLQYAVPLDDNAWLWDNKTKIIPIPRLYNEYYKSYKN